jgi:hypothetical protein
MKKTAESEALEFLDQIQKDMATAEKKSAAAFGRADIERAARVGVGTWISGLSNYLAVGSMRAADAARRDFLSQNSSEIAAACSQIVAAKSVHRDACRSAIGDKIARIVRFQAIGSPSLRESEGLERQLMSLEAELEDFDRGFNAAQSSIKSFVSARNFEIETLYDQVVRSVRDLRPYPAPDEVLV